MHFFDFNISDHLHGRWCRFIIHRYLGHLLEKNLSLDQLSIDLTQGSVAIEQVMLNAQYVNEVLEGLNVPLRLVDGFIGSIRIRVPWRQLMADASQVDLSDVQLTFRATDAVKLDDRDLVSSMIGSVVESLVSSMDLAESFRKEEKEEGEWDSTDEDSVHALSKVVDAVVSRFCCRIDDLILRIEADSTPASDMSTAVEFKITKLEFMDEQMQHCKQDGTGAETIRTQPHGLSSITNLNKLLTLNGISLYTDTFAKGDLPSTTGDLGSPVTSMYLRREHKKSLQKAGSPNASMYMSSTLNDSTVSGLYQSCYTSIVPDNSEFKSVRSDIKLMSNPVKFAEITGETKIVIRIKNSDIQASDKKDNKFEFDVYSKSLHVLATPSQIELVRALAMMLMPMNDRGKRRTDTGEPMVTRDYDAVNRQLDDITMEGYSSGGNALGRTGNWMGVQNFHSFQSISLNNEQKGSIGSIKQSASTTAIGDTSGKRETAKITLNVGSLLVFITHEDPFNADVVAGMERGALDAIDILHANAKRFFEKAPLIKLSVPSAVDDLYPRDHIRLVGSSVSAFYSVETVPSGAQRLSTKFSVANCDISEFLCSESTVENNGIRRNPLFKFERDNDDAGAQFTVVTKNEDRKSSTVIQLGKCSSELDMSITDRISDLIYPRPFFTVPSAYHKHRANSEMSGLREDLFSEVVTKEVPESTIEIDCGNWSIDLMIPKVDLREGGEKSLPHTIRNVHEESLRLKLTACRVSIPSKDPNGPKSIDISASKITGYFLGDTEKLGCNEKENAFLYAGSKTKPVRICLEYDGSNKSLKASGSGLLPTTMEDDMTKSTMRVNELLKSKPKKEGPFAQTHQSFMRADADYSDENIVRAGSREEMLAFASDCLEQSDVTLRIQLPLLRLLVPNHQFLELLYNRLVNDFALWQPSSPAFKHKTTQLNVAFDDFKEMNVGMGGTRHNGDSDDEDLVEGYTRTRERTIAKAQSHVFSLELDVQQGTLVMGTDIAPAKEGESPQLAQLAADLTASQLFVCYGFHGDLNQTFFHMTTKNITLAQRNGERSIPTNIANKDFGTFSKDEVHLRSLSTGSHLREDRRDDSLGVALHLVTSADGKTKETTAAIAFRLLEMNIIPFRRFEEWWIAQLKDLFTLQDFDIPGYEMPISNTYLHVHMDHAVLVHDHSRIIPESTLRYKLVLGNVDINSTLVPTMKVNKFLFLFERVHLHVTESDNDDESRVVSYEDEPRSSSSSNMVHIMEIGLFQLELLLYNQLLAAPNEARKCPLFELRCKNDQIKVWVCHDSLVSLINTIVEVSQSGKWGEERIVDEEPSLTEEQTKSMMSSNTKSTSTTVKKGESLPPGAEKRLMKMVESACEETPSTYEPTSGVAYGREALDMWNDDNALNQNLLDDAMRDMTIGGNRTTSMSTDDEFFMVEDIVGCGITSSSGEPRIRIHDSDYDEEDKNFNFTYVPEYIPQSGDLRSDCIPLPADYPIPLSRYVVKDISIQLHIFSGNDLGKDRDTPKSYSADEYREGVGKGQSVAKEARGGPFRDHSVSIVVELSKISYLHQLFDKEASARAMNFISIQDMIVHDKLTLSNIKEMLYQYETTEHPRRTCAPMLAIRMVENHQQEGKLRVSMLPLRVNVDQDTFEFLEDFVATVARGLALPETSKLQLQNRPVIEVPQPVEGRSASLSHQQPLPSPLPTSTPLQPTPSPNRPATNPFVPQFSKLAAMDDLDDLHYLGNTSPVEALPPTRPPRPSKDVPPSLDDDFINDLMPDTSSSRLYPVVQQNPSLESVQGQSSNPFDEDCLNPFDESPPLTATRNLFDMNASQTEAALKEHPEGDWADSSDLHITSEMSNDDLLARSTMEGSIYGQQGNLIDDDIPMDDNNFLSEDDRYGVETTVPNGDDDEDNDTICSEAADATALNEDKLRGMIFFKDFIFSPAASIYIDYQGKNKFNMDRSGAVIGVLRGIGQLNRTEIYLKAFEHKNGLLGVGRCATFAFNEWQESIRANLPGVLSSVGPISPLVQIGKGIRDIFWMPMAELRKDDGHVVKGLQRGAGSFGFSTAAAVVDIAQRLVGVFQLATESMLYEISPDHPALNNRNRRPVLQRAQQPRDVRHGMQLAYDLIADGVQQTREDIELATQEDRASGRSSMRSAIRFAVPAVLRPFVITSQIGYQLLGSLKNQLRPDQFQDEQHKYRLDRQGGSQ